MSPFPTERISLLLVDDHEVVRGGLRTLFRGTEMIEVVGEATNMATAVSEAVRLKPHVVLMDIRFLDGSGVEACREIRVTCPGTRVLFLTSYSAEEAALASISGGADGFLLKDIAGEALIQGIKTVAGGQSILDPAVTRPILDRIRSLTAAAAAGQEDALSPQERKVLALVAEGKTNKEIAIALELSDRTMKNYLSNVFQKLQVSRRTQAAAIFIADSSKPS
jgi:two-component system response regulator DevR